ncbi:hypothetical protein M1N55_06520 [Dehalococcoidia bacterium]|nr:hypothetical protein [Dehalococcoidia bacterium]
MNENERFLEKIKLLFESYPSKNDLSKKLSLSVLGLNVDKEIYILAQRILQKTLQEIGNELNVSRERIRQLENKSMNKLSVDSSVIDKSGLDPSLLKFMTILHQMTLDLNAYIIEHSEGYIFINALAEDLNINVDLLKIVVSFGYIIFGHTGEKFPGYKCQLNGATLNSQKKYPDYYAIYSSNILNSELLRYIKSSDELFITSKKAGSDLSLDFNPNTYKVLQDLGLVRIVHSHEKAVKKMGYLLINTNKLNGEFTISKKQFITIDAIYYIHTNYVQNKYQDGATADNFLNCEEGVHIKDIVDYCEFDGKEPYRAFYSGAERWVENESNLFVMSGRNRLGLSFLNTVSKKPVRKDFGQNPNTELLIDILKKNNLLNEKELTGEILNRNPDFVIGSIRLILSDMNIFSKTEEDYYFLTKNYNKKSQVPMGSYEIVISNCLNKIEPAKFDHIIEYLNSKNIRLSYKTVHATLLRKNLTYNHHNNGEFSRIKNPVINKGDWDHSELSTVINYYLYLLKIQQARPLGKSKPLIEISKHLHSRDILREANQIDGVFRATSYLINKLNKPYLRNFSPHKTSFKNKKIEKILSEIL